MNDEVRVRKIVTVHDERERVRSLKGKVVVVDDDESIGLSLTRALAIEGYAVSAFLKATDFIDHINRKEPAFAGPCCLICDLDMPFLTGLELQNYLADHRQWIVLFISGAADKSDVAHAFRHGAVDFLFKPVTINELIEGVELALKKIAAVSQLQEERVRQQNSASSLSSRELRVLTLVSEGTTNQEISDCLMISIRTVKLDRHNAMNKLALDSVPAVVRFMDSLGRSNDGPK